LSQISLPHVAVGVGRGRNCLTSFNCPDPLLLTRICYTSWVISHFVSDFVAMATGVVRG